MNIDSAATPEGLAAVSAHGANLLRKLAASNKDLTEQLAAANEKIASLERRERLHALADEMEEHGLSPELSHDEKIASLSSFENLDHVASAIKLAGGGKLSLPRVSDAAGPGASGASTDSFIQFCLTGQGNNP